MLFRSVGVKGLNASVVHQMGDDRAETDVVVGYTIPEGEFKGLGARLMHGMYNTDRDNEADKTQTRFIVSYSIPLM